MLTGKNFIAGKLSAEGTRKFTAVNPVNGSAVETQFAEATSSEISAAIEQADAAFAEFRSKTAEEKAVFLEAIAEEIMALGDELLARCTLETGLGEVRLKGERARTVNQLKLYALFLRDGWWCDARIDSADANRTPPKPDLRSIERAIGPVGVFGASNFPFAYSVAGGDTVSALAAGCPVVVKGHPAHPGTTEMVAQALTNAARKTRMPAGVFSMVHGASVEVGMAIVNHPAIKAIGFTGSFNGGKALYDAAQKREVPIPVYAEMGSTNPIFVLPEALKQRADQIAADLAASVTLGVGQFCTNPGLVFIADKPEKEALIDGLTNAVSQVAPGVMLTAGIRQNYLSGIERLKTSGASVVSTGKPATDSFTVSSHVFQASAREFLSDPVLEHEVFGPSTVTIAYENREQLIRIARELGGHLTATVHGTDEELLQYKDLIDILEQKAGRLIINGYPTGVEVNHAMVHGGPFPATTDSRTTSVGTKAIRRFTRPVCYQNFPQALLPEELRDGNPLTIWRLVDGEWGKK